VTTWDSWVEVPDQGSSCTISYQKSAADCMEGTRSTLALPAALSNGSAGGGLLL
jgi:hypothetical protein